MAFSLPPFRSEMSFDFLLPKRRDNIADINPIAQNGMRLNMFISQPRIAREESGP
jgi:hypothetical protein